MARFTNFGRLEPFDRDRTYIAKRYLKLSGKGYHYGDVIDKTKLTTRRLRQLYELRYIEMVDEDFEFEDVSEDARELDRQEEPNDASDYSGNEETPVSKPVFSEMDRDELMDWVAERGRRLHHNTGHKKLVEIAEELWNENDGVTA